MKENFGVSEGLAAAFPKAKGAAAAVVTAGLVVEAFPNWKAVVACVVEAPAPPN